MNMYKIYLKQAWALLKENKLLSGVSIFGTALAICMIMVIVIVWQMRTANYSPEDYRDRMMYVSDTRASYKENESYNDCYFLASRVVKDCFYPLRSAEKVGMAYHGVQRLAAVADHTVEFKCDVTFTDAAFWNIFNFRFLSGKPYGEEEVQSGIMDAVVSESVARRLYGTTEVVGRTVEISYVPYTIRAVVRDVSLLAESAYGDVWLPYTTDNSLYDNGSDRLVGGFRCYILASSSADFDAIHSEAEANIARLNESQSTHLLKIGGGPDTHLGDLAREDAFSEPNVRELVMKYVIIVLVLLLIPAINMSGITQSRMRKRMAEIGVRKAFGITDAGTLRESVADLAGRCVRSVFLIRLRIALVRLVARYGHGIDGYRSHLRQCGDDVQSIDLPLCVPCLSCVEPAERRHPGLASLKDAYHLGSQRECSLISRVG
mgnify:CR=1 FL=1